MTPPVIIPILEELPRELKLQVLFDLPTMESIYSLIRASPAFRRTYSDVAEEVLAHVALRVLADRGIDLVKLLGDSNNEAIEVFMKANGREPCG